MRVILIPVSLADDQRYLRIPQVGIIVVVEERAEARSRLKKSVVCVLSVGEAPFQLTAMRLLSCFLALGTVTLRMPSLRFAVTAAWSTGVGKLKVRWNSPTERSETQNLSFGG